MYIQKTIKYIGVIFLVILFTSSLKGQSLFTGRITYDISYIGMMDLATQEQLPREVEIVAKNEMVRTEMEAGELNQVKIADSENKTVTTILEILREKYIIHKTHEDIRRSLRDMPEPKITYTDETREILGYECKKAEAIVYDQFGEENVIDIFYTEEIPGEPFNFDLPYSEIPGLMLLYEIQSGNLVMQYEATSVRSRWGIFISNRNFRPPRDAQEITFEELREKLQ